MTTSLAFAFVLGCAHWFTPLNSSAAFIVESRAGGVNFDNYSDASNWNNNTNKSSAAGLTAGIGSRSVGTLLSGIGEQHALFTSDLPDTGLYEVFTTWGPVGGRRNPILYRVTHASGISDVPIDQSTTFNEWVSLGQYVFNSGTGGGMVDMSNLLIDEPGVMVADAVKWELISLIVVPEPGTLTLLGLTTVGAVGLVRRRPKRPPPHTANRFSCGV